MCCYMYSAKPRGELALKIQSDHPLTFIVTYMLQKYEGHVFGNEKEEKNVCILDDVCQTVLYNQEKSL